MLWLTNVEIIKLQSSDEELPAEEEAEVLRLQREKAKLLSMEDFGLEDTERDESDGEPTIEVWHISQRYSVHNKWNYEFFKIGQPPIGRIRSF